jgi:hypothetical protein
MPKPKQTAKSKLPAEKGIRTISFGLDGEESGDLEVRLGGADRALVEQIRTDLERSHGRPFEVSQIVRWALWHCQTDGQ